MCGGWVRYHAKGYGNRWEAYGSVCFCKLTYVFEITQRLTSLDGCQNLYVHSYFKKKLLNNESLITQHNLQPVRERRRATLRPSQHRPCWSRRSARAAPSSSAPPPARERSLVSGGYYSDETRMMRIRKGVDTMCKVRHYR